MTVRRRVCGDAALPRCAAQLVEQFVRINPPQVVTAEIWQPWSVRRTTVGDAAASSTQPGGHA
jgi:hypothetical protein